MYEQTSAIRLHKIAFERPLFRRFELPAVL